MKTVVLVALLSVIGFAAHAQKTIEKNFHFSIGPEISFATGKFNETQSVGFGGTVQGSYRVATSTDVTLTTGVVSYIGRSAGAGIKYKGAVIIPIRAGVKYYVTEGFYGQAQLGVGIFNNGGGAGLAYSPVMGYEFDTKSGQAFDIGVKYDGYFKNGSALGAFGVRLAYKF